MSVIVVGVDHQRAPLELLERLNVTSVELPSVLSELSKQDNFQERIVLSTCLRTEVYAVVDRFHDAVFHIQGWFADRAGESLDDLVAQIDVSFDDDVVAHLFSVAAGLESAVLGESEVQGQVRRAWEVAESEKASGPVLAELFRHALRAGRRVRSETGIARGTTSFSHAAVELIERSHRLGGSTVAVVGAGQVARGVLDALVGRTGDDRPAELLVTSRNERRARELLSRLPGSRAGRVLPFDRVGEVFGLADVVITALGGDAAVIGPTELRDHLAVRTSPLLVVDMGLPRNVAHDVARNVGVTVFDLDDLREAVSSAVKGRENEVAAARSILTEEVGRYRTAARERGAGPVIAHLRTRLDELRKAELDKRRAKFSSLSDDEWSQVDALTKSVLAKLLHEPTIQLKDSAGTSRGERLVEALRTLFDL